MCKLTDAHIEELDREGFIILPDFIRGDELKMLQVAQRRVLPTWEDVKENPPQNHAGHSLLVCFPHEEMELYKAAMHEESIDFARKWLKTEGIHMRVGCLSPAIQAIPRAAPDSMIPAYILVMAIIPHRP